MAAADAQNAETSAKYVESFMLLLPGQCKVEAEMVGEKKGRMRTTTEGSSYRYTQRIITTTWQWKGNAAGTK